VTDLPTAVTEWLAGAGWGEIRAVDEMRPGAINRVRRIRTASGRTAVIKTDPGAPPDLYACEADGLRAITQPGAPRVPRVLLVTEHCLLLEDLGTRIPGPGFWPAFGRALASLHAVTSPAYGYDRTNYLGRVKLQNPWTEDGWEFFATCRLLVYLEHPESDRWLTASDRAGVERVARRLRDLVPWQPPSLIHGDLWHSNLLVGPAGEPALIDPAPYFGWPEAELAMTRQCGEVPRELFDAYVEHHPLEPGFWDRLEVYFLREELNMVCHFGNQYGSLDRLRDLVEKYG
jgi:fructosamine-3-kinase